jgi:co-chaperonin GroES (HSP10)
MMMMSEAEILTDEQLEKLLPVPVGYRVLIALPQIEENFQDSDLLKASQTRHEEHIMSIIGLVVDMGDQAYADKDRFPTGAWCKQGDYVMFRANSGTRFRIGGTEYRLMNDDSIEAVVPDPSSITRV